MYALSVLYLNFTRSYHAPCIHRIQIINNDTLSNVQDPEDPDFSGVVDFSNAVPGPDGSWCITKVISMNKQALKFTKYICTYRREKFKRASFK